MKLYQIRESDGSSDWINKIKFSDYLFDQRYHQLKKDFVNLDFLWEEDTDRLLVYRAIADDIVSRLEIEKLAPSFFPTFIPTHLNLYQRDSVQLVSNLITTDQLDDRAIILAPDDATGVISIMLIIDGLEQQSPNHLHNLLSSFEERAGKLEKALEQLGN